jgi:hypothetical protein
VVQEVVLHLRLTVDRAVGHLPVARRNPTSSSLGNELATMFTEIIHKKRQRNSLLTPGANVIKLFCPSFI